jgi:hypothetical protein
MELLPLFLFSKPITFPQLGHRQGFRKALNSAQTQESVTNYPQPEWEQTKKWSIVPRAGVS